MVEAARVVPLKDVFALEEMLPEVLVVDNTFALVVDVDDRESADVELMLDWPATVLTLDETSADVVDAAVETPTVEDGVSSALPGDGVFPDPAPEDDPAVFGVAADDELPVNDD